MHTSTQHHKSTNVRTLFAKRRKLRKRYRAAVRDVSRRTVQASVGTLARVAPAAAIDAAAFLFFKPQRSAVADRERPVLDAAQPMRVAQRGGVLRGWTWGPRDAPPVLLVHGWSGRAGQLSAFVEPLLEQGHRVVAFDLSGHGESSGRQTNIVKLAEDVLAIGDYIGPLAGIVTHSFGGPVTTLALVAGLRADRAVFIAPPFDGGAWIGSFARWLGFDEALSERLLQRLESTVGLKFEEMSGTSLAPEMTVPLLVIHDENDVDVALAEGTRLAGCWPNAELHQTQGLGHHRILGDREVVSSALRFIRNENGEPS